jgi:hypothetical protein
MAVAASSTTTTSSDNKRNIQNAWNWNCERCASHLVSVDETHPQFLAGGPLVINRNFLDGTDLLFFQITVPGMISFGRQVLKSINWSLLLLLLKKSLLFYSL